ncbi:PrsW family intramembrane metalloprotease [Deinococcus peraridilitoris]|uniref:Putative membrane protein n=1 Tax=Deinococcus peraridilitoris (strain DSM 19664 / LMG 22246 / CIP 109416 / KR-200) TaxID=937777 RepID=L0A1G6_DEIPD|nr:PrsW family glutamic-type intramembrane protease [Deinococcus peraridilitoris]AFZ67666.1 putative membrane protein [Deinococcus peraridilitoris DSM 19664]
MHRFRAVRQSILLEVSAVVVFVALIALLSPLLPPLSGTPLVLAGLLIALVPATLWLTAFYRQDRLDPEPKEYILGVFALGVVLALGVGQPLLRNVFHLQDWVGGSPFASLIGLIFVAGLTQEFLKYAAVRYGVFNTPEFDHPVDGIVYAATAGLGFATSLNVAYVLAGGVNLGMAALHVSISTLAHASFAGVMGYFLGRAKFEARPVLWLPGGLLLAATLNGVVSYALREVPFLTFTFNPWLGLLVAAIVALATFSFLFARIRSLEQTVTQRGGVL